MNRLNAFTLLCDCISPWNNSRESVEQLRKRLISGGKSWELFVEAANKHLLCPALYGVLRHKNLLSFVPADLRDYLQILNHLNRERNRLLEEHAEQTALLLNEIGVEPVLLKGTANLLSGLYLDKSVRFISDMDILVPENRLADCMNRLRAAGYDYLFPSEDEYWKTHHHGPPLLKKDCCFRIELHSRLLSRQPRNLIDACEVLSDSIPLSIGISRVRIPSTSHRLIHNVAHAQLADRDFLLGNLQLRQLYDLILLAEKIQEEEWQKISFMFDRFGYSSAFAGYLLAGEKYFHYSPCYKIRKTSAARLYLAGIGIQANHIWLMHLGNLVRLALFYGIRLKNLLSYRKIPRIWERKNRQAHYNQMRYILSRNW
jgi:hypothetical protein